MAFVVAIVEREDAAVPDRGPLKITMAESGARC